MRKPSGNHVFSTTDKTNMAKPKISIFSPDTLGKPLGQQSQRTRVKASEFLFIAGQLAADKAGKVIGADDFGQQCVQVFANIHTALKAVDAGWGDAVQFTTYPFTRRIFQNS